MLIPMIFGLIFSFLSGLCLGYMVKMGNSNPLGAIIANMVGVTLTLAAFVSFMFVFGSFMTDNLWIVITSYFPTMLVVSLTSLMIKKG